MKVDTRESRKILTYNMISFQVSHFTLERHLKGLRESENYQDKVLDLPYLMPSLYLEIVVLTDNVSS